jgi:hypothetical protein
MPRNRMSDLRNHLFETLEELKDKDKPMDLARAKTISDVAQTIINSAKVEVDLMKTMGASDSGEFFESRHRESPEIGAPTPLRQIKRAGR